MEVEVFYDETGKALQEIVEQCFEEYSLSLETLPFSDEHDIMDTSICVSD